MKITLKQIDIGHIPGYLITSSYAYTKRGIFDSIPTNLKINWINSRFN